MAEQLNLTVPAPSTANYRISCVIFDWDAAAITIRMRGNNAEPFSHTISGATATTLMNQLNVVNLSTQSLHKRIMNRLISDGVLSGTVAGSPD